MKEIMIRHMVVEDIFELSQLYRLFRDEESSIQCMQNIFAKMDKNEDYYVLSAVKQDKLVGSISGVVCMDLYGDCRPYMVVENFVVAADSRRKGIGEKLFTSIETIAKERGCTQIILITDNDRKDAIQFYTKMGFDPNKNRGFKKLLYD